MLESLQIEPENETFYVVGWNPNLDGWWETPSLEEAIEFVMDNCDPNNKQYRPDIFCKEDYWDAICIARYDNDGFNKSWWGKSLYELLLEHGKELTMPEGFTW